MSQPTYTLEVIVLRKTKLGESDLILTCLDSEGAQARLVAKGARKPTSSFSSRLELFAHAHVLAVKGKSLDIVKEVRLLSSHDELRTSYERTAAASVLCEFLCKVTETSLTTPRLYEMTLAALGAMAQCPYGSLESLAAASVLKGFALIGLRPELQHCVECGQDVQNLLNAEGHLWFSYADGGVVCSKCSHGANCLAVETGLLRWIYAFLYGTFSEVADMDVSSSAFAVLQMCQQWCRVHIGYPLKSIEFLLAQPIVGS